MKFIHTADWHLGNSMHDIDRSKEAEQFLQWLKTQIVENGAEALVIAGDVFDVVNPSNEAKKQYYRFLASLIESCCKNIIVIGGNHDSGPLLDAPAELLSALNVQVIGGIGKRTLEDMVVEMKNDSGESIGICCAVPFMRDLELKNFYKNELGDDSDSFETELLKRFYNDIYNRALEIRGDRNIPIIATGHLYAANLSGRESSNSERSQSSFDDGVRDVVGTLGNVSVDVFPKDFDYVALGHVHYETMVAKNPKIRYSGSPFVMGFDESKIARKVLLVKTGSELHVEKIEVPGFIRFEQIAGDLPTIKTKLKALEQEFKNAPIETYVDIILTSGELVNLNDALAAEENCAHFVVKRHRISRDILRKSGGSYSDGIESTKQYQKEDYFKMLIAKNIQSDVDSDDVKKCFDDFIDLFKEAVDLASTAGEEN